MQLDQNAITFILGLVALVSILIQVYNAFRTPQIKSDQTDIKLEDRIRAVEKAVLDIKETHIRSIESDIKSLTISVNELSKTVVKLSTIIDERIPKATPNLTPPTNN